MSHPEPAAIEPRFPAVSRRAFLQRSGAAALAAAVIPALAACSSSTPTTPTTTSGNTQAAATPAQTVIPTTSASANDVAGAFPAAGDMRIDFTYQASGGRIHDPYIAVWIEDAAGDLVQTVSLWFKSDESKYLRDLKRWSSKNNSAVLTSGATRIPGAYTVMWDGSDLDGALVADGNYFVCIEAARENGPYQIIRESVAVSAALAPTILSANGELTAASVELV